MKNPPLDFSPMPPEEYVADLKALGLAISHADKTRNPRRSAAYLFGFSPRESRYYASGRRQVPHALAALIRILVVLHYTPDQIANGGSRRPSSPNPLKVAARRVSGSRPA